MKSGVFPDPMAHAVSYLLRRRAPVSLTPARQPLRRPVASWLRRSPQLRHSSLVIPHSHSSCLRVFVVQFSRARKKTSAPKPFASTTATAALAPMRFTPRHAPKSRVNMRKAQLSNGFAATQKPTKFRQPPAPLNALLASGLSPIPHSPFIIHHSRLSTAPARDLRGATRTAQKNSTPKPYSQRHCKPWRYHKQGRTDRTTSRTMIKHNCQ